MKRFTSVFTGTLLVGGMAFGQDKQEGQPVPRAVTEIEKRAEKEVYGMRCEYNEKVSKCLLKYEAELKKVQSDLSKQDKLEEALAVKNYVEGFKLTIMKKVDDNALEGFKKDDDKNEEKSKKDVSKNSFPTGKWVGRGVNVIIKKNVNGEYEFSANPGYESTQCVIEKNTLYAKVGGYTYIAKYNPSSKEKEIELLAYGWTFTTVESFKLNEKIWSKERAYQGIVMPLKEK